MAFKPPGPGVDFEHIITILNNARIQDSNNALYQTIFGLIKQTQKLQTETSGISSQVVQIVDGISGGGGGGGGIPIVLNQTYLTANNETAALPNSKQLLAGTGITFDDSIPNQRTISASEAPEGYWTLLTDGDVDETDFIFADGDAISIFVPE